MSKFKLVKHQVIRCLVEGSVLHEARDCIEIKNLLSTGAVSIEDVTELMKRSRGSEYEFSPHHMGQSIDVHVVKTIFKQESWYVKWYFIEPDAVFISVHK